MLKADRLSQLKQLLEKLQQGLKKIPSSHTQGQIVEILKTISFFRTEADNYGTQILSHYIPLIQPYMLRAGMQIIGHTHEYVVVEGIIKGMKLNGQFGRTYTDGMLVEPLLQEKKSAQQKQTFFSTETMDSALIKVLKNSYDQKLQKYCQNLYKFQKQRIAKIRQNQIIMISDKNLQACKQNLKKYEFFANIGTYDINDLVIQSKLVILNKGATLHNYGEVVTRVGFLISGQIKVDNSVLHEKQKHLQAGKQILEKYMIHRKQKKSSVISFVQPGQWIGLQEYFWNQDCFLSNAEIASHDAQIMLIPTEIFRKKFNEFTSFFLINKIKGLIETKKRLLQKTIKTKREKEQQKIHQKQKAEAISKLKLKLQVQKSQSSRNNEILSHIMVQNNKYNNSYLKPREKSLSIQYPKKCYMPERLIHKIKVFEEKYSSLPRIKQRLVLFPQEYQKAMVPLDLRQQLKAAKNAKNKKQLKASIKPFRLLSSEKVYETVIYQSLNPKCINPEQSIPRIKSKTSIQFQQVLSTLEEGSMSPRTHYNESIYNNFRAPKNKGKKLLQNLSKTLQII